MRSCDTPDQCGRTIVDPWLPSALPRRNAMPVRRDGLRRHRSERPRFGWCSTWNKPSAERAARCPRSTEAGARWSSARGGSPRGGIGRPASSAFLPVVVLASQSAGSGVGLPAPDPPDQRGRAPPATAACWHVGADFAVAAVGVVPGGDHHVWVAGVVPGWRSEQRPKHHLAARGSPRRSCEAASRRSSSSGPPIPPRLNPHSHTASTRHATGLRRFTADLRAPGKLSGGLVCGLGRGRLRARVEQWRPAAVSLAGLPVGMRGLRSAPGLGPAPWDRRRGACARRPGPDQSRLPHALNRDRGAALRQPRPPLPAHVPHQWTTPPILRSELFQVSVHGAASPGESCSTRIAELQARLAPG
jgi:hypothetical protein